MFQLKFISQIAIWVSLSVPSSES